MAESEKSPSLKPTDSSLSISQSLERSEEVAYAIARNDWDALRKLSVQPGGFGEHSRKDAWVHLLHAQGSPEPLPPPVIPKTESRPNTLQQSSDISDDLISEKVKELEIACERELAEEPHGDERQVGLDTDRSFVLYPVEPPKEKSLRKAQLHNLIVAVLRKRRKLSYFQGYHDVISVLLLTLQDSLSASPQPSSLLVSSAEKISLHRLRDAMGAGLEPVSGLLRLLKRLFRAADPELAQTIESVSPLPYFALSNILTLFSHDAPTLDIIQRIFDYLLCRSPVCVVYLAAAMVLARKSEIKKLEEEGEDGMMHSILSQLPEIVADGDSPARGRTTNFKPPEISRSGSRSYSNSIVLRNTGDGKPPSVEHLTPPVGSPPSPPQGPGDQKGSADVESGSSFLLQSTITEGEETTLIDDSSLASAPRGDVISSTFSLPEDPPPANSVNISSLLQDADTLFARFPPTHPSINAQDIMGPNSVIFTWSEHEFTFKSVSADALRPEKRDTLPSDDVAEAMVLDKNLVVRPYDPMEDVDSLPPFIGPPARRPRLVWDMSKVDKRTVLASVVVLISVGVALYSTSQGRGGADWKRLANWVGGMVTVVGLGSLDEIGSFEDEL